MKEAFLYEKMEKNKVHCELCNVSCVIEDGKRGQCGIRENRDGTLHALTYEKPISTSVDPIEKKPLFNFRPGSRAFSIATVGCNFKCGFCQNWQISQPKEIVGNELGVKEVVDQASRTADGIAYTYTEPTVFMEYAYDIAELAKKRGLYNVFVSNGYMTDKAIEKIAPVLDAINIDLKAMSDDFYKEFCGVSSHKPVLNSIKKFKEKGVWVEVTNLLIPGKNTKESQIRELCEWLVENVGEETPLHFSRFLPHHEMNNVEPTSNEIMNKAVDIAQKSGLKYIYVGNLAHKNNNTFCPECGEKVIDRKGYSVFLNTENGYKCPECGYELDIRR